MKKYIIGYQTHALDGYTATIIDIIDKNTVLIQYANGLQVKRSIKHIRDIKNSNMPKSTRQTEIKDKRCYSVWTAILNRALYHTQYKEKIAYNDTSICEKWRDYNNFEEWYLQNYYELPNGERVEIDKDILFKHNKIYSPETCIFVPQKINSLFVNRSKETIKNRINKITDINEKELPVGITWCKDKQIHRYRASLNIGGQKVINLGRFKTLEEAFAVYKKAKEDRIKQFANEYKPYIPKKLYDALINYSVEMDD